MSRKTHHRNSETRENEHTDQITKDRLFSKSDAKSIDTSSYIVRHGAPQTDQSINESLMPTGAGKLFIE